MRIADRPPAATADPAPAPRAAVAARRVAVAIAVAVAVAAAAAALLASPSARASWRPPVDDAIVTRGFDLGTNPFEGGRHRGVDLAARAGDDVRAPCAGEVVVAGRVGTSGRVVTVRCDAWRVSHMPLATIAPRVGDRVAAGAALGTAAPSRAHAGLHLGVRREGDRFGYVDPLGFLAARRTTPPIVGGRRPPPIRVTRPPRLGPAPRAQRPPNRLRRAAPAAAPARPAGAPARPAAAPARDSNPVAVPWPAWAGAALMLAGLGFRLHLGPRPRRGLARRPLEGIR